MNEEKELELQKMRKILEDERKNSKEQYDKVCKETSEERSMMGDEIRALKAELQRIKEDKSSEVKSMVRLELYMT